MKQPEKAVPSTAMVLAAGLGVRMRPYTEDRPKPLIEVGGRTLLDRTLDKLAAAGVKKVVVNLHYKADLLRRHVAKRQPMAPEIVFSDESEQLLDTGGGVTAALRHLGDEPFLVVNSDIIWLDGGDNTLHRMATSWDPATMDALLLMVPVEDAVGYHGDGDYNMAPGGRLSRKKPGAVAPFLFGGIQILQASLFAEAPEDPFSLNLIYDTAETMNRLSGIRHHGTWMHVGTPDAVRDAETRLRIGAGAP